MELSLPQRRRAYTSRRGQNMPSAFGLPLMDPTLTLAKMMRDDGTWSLKYFQENLNPEDRDTAFTNRALLACRDNKVPIGVLAQVTKSPTAYRVLGLGIVTDWDSGYFMIEGFNSTGHARF
jgi:hypothetical protein